MPPLTCERTWWSTCLGQRYAYSLQIVSHITMLSNVRAPRSRPVRETQRIRARPRIMVACINCKERKLKVKTIASEQRSIAESSTQCDDQVPACANCRRFSLSMSLWPIMDSCILVPLAHCANLHCQQLVRWKTPSRNEISPEIILRSWRTK